MRKTLIVGCSLIFILVSCAPAVSTTVPIPPETPTIIPTAIVVNPPPCWGGDLIYDTSCNGCSWSTVSPTQVRNGRSRYGAGMGPSDNESPKAGRQGIIRP